jgi:hypothetical protein
VVKQILNNELHKISWKWSDKGNVPALTSAPHTRNYQIKVMSLRLLQHQDKNDLIKVTTLRLLQRHTQEITR